MNLKGKEILIKRLERLISDADRIKELETRHSDIDLFEKRVITLLERLGNPKFIKEFEDCFPEDVDISYRERLGYPPKETKRYRLREYGPATDESAFFGRSDIVNCIKNLLVSIKEDVELFEDKKVKKGIGKIKRKWAIEAGIPGVVKTKYEEEKDELP